MRRKTRTNPSRLPVSIFAPTPATSALPALTMMVRGQQRAGRRRARSVPALHRACPVGPIAAMELRARTFAILDGSPNVGPLGRALGIALLALILANVAATVLETVPSLGERHAGAFLAFERVSIAVFTAEYLLRV